MFRYIVTGIIGINVHLKYTCELAVTDGGHVGRCTYFRNNIYSNIFHLNILLNKKYNLIQTQVKHNNNV